MMEPIKVKVELVGPDQDGGFYVVTSGDENELKGIQRLDDLDAARRYAANEFLEDE